MTKDKDLKRLIRARATRTGESYSTARRTLLQKGSKSAPETQDVWFSRASQGYSGKGTKPIGSEHVTITVTARGIKVTVDGALKSYGVHDYAITSDGAARSSRCELRGGQIAIVGRVKDGAWTCTVEHDGETSAVTLDAPGPADEIVPSVAARFLPVMLPREVGELVSYVPVPEDGFPAWRPPGKGSFFPVMGASPVSLVEPRVIVGRGEETGKGKNAPSGFRYDHITADGTLRGTTWIDEAGCVVAFERTGLILRAISEDRARSLDPRTGGER